MSPQSYFMMERGDKTIFTMETMEIIFKDIIALLVQYDDDKNIPLLTVCNDYYVTEVFGNL